ncbi:MAG: hypothetical protein OQK32_01755 [Gammaproteobacteria bacterium]|nr:hypothetical protein [Gammaproteobacteria bacterium]MCW8923119.1 hypothetical protein [Gammaproteobacteria bacterium]
MKKITQISGKALALSALTLVMSGPLYADEPVSLTEGVTINVAGTADAVPSSCTGTGPYSCPTLRDAIVFANENANSTEYDIINLGAGTYTLTIAGTNEDAAVDGDLDITEAVNIVGAGSDTTIIDGGGSGGTLQERIFTINGVVVEISDLTLTNGFAKSAA